MTSVNPPKLVPLPDYREYPPAEMARRARELAADLRRRRSVREFSNRPVEREVIEQCLAAAVSAPSGANRQPWHFVAVSDLETKQRIRLAAEEEEREFYGRRAPQEWLEALEPLGTDEHKPFLETAPYLIAVFSLAWGYDEAGRRVKHYYVSESVGIAVGLLIGALHHAGLVCLTHTPSPMRFLREILRRPEHERPYLLLPVGYPAAGAEVPDISRKPIDEVVSFR
jgi:iodotyrosine deiodinase